MNSIEHAPASLLEPPVPLELPLPQAYGLSRSQSAVADMQLLRYVSWIGFWYLNYILLAIKFLNKQIVNLRATFLNYYFKVYKFTD